MKLSQIPTNASPAVADYMVGVTAAGVDDRVTLAQLAALISANITAGSQTNSIFDTDTKKGWNLLGVAPTTITYLGNRAYSIVFPSVDYSGVLSNGMRLRSTRTVASPTRCTLLNGSSQYYSKTTPAGMAQTDNISLGGWIKPTSYQNSHIWAKTATAGTDGYRLYISSTGNVFINANGRYASTVLTVPLNEWTHIVVTLSMSTSTAIIYVDGVAVATTALSGAGAAITNAGNLWVGSRESGAEPFAGELSQLFLASKVLSAAEAKAIYSQGITSANIATYSIVSAFSFDGAITDINTTNANNLTANGSAVATAADSPFGGQANGTINSLLDYMIVTKVAFVTDTTVNVQVPRGCTIPTSGGIGSVSYSNIKEPYGMPIQKSKYNVEFMQNSQISTPGVAGTWVNGGGKLNIPIGEWDTGYEGPFLIGTAGSTFLNVQATLSTGATTESDRRFSARTPNISPSVTQQGAMLSRRNPLSLAAATDYFLNLLPSHASTVYWDGPSGSVIIRAELAYV